MWRRTRWSEPLPPPSSFEYRPRTHTKHKSMLQIETTERGSKSCSIPRDGDTPPYYACGYVFVFSFACLRTVHVCVRNASDYDPEIHWRSSHFPLTSFSLPPFRHHRPALSELRLTVLLSHMILNVESIILSIQRCGSHSQHVQAASCGVEKPQNFSLARSLARFLWFHLVIYPELMVTDLTVHITLLWCSK